MVFDGPEQPGRIGDCLPLISAGLCPVLGDDPVRIHRWICSQSLKKIFLQFRKPEELFQIVTIVLIRFLLWKIMFLSPLGDTSLQRTFNRVSCQVVCAIRKSGVEQGPGFSEAQYGDLLKIAAVLSHVSGALTPGSGKRPHWYPRGSFHPH